MRDTTLPAVFTPTLYRPHAPRTVFKHTEICEWVGAIVSRSTTGSRSPPFLTQPRTTATNHETTRKRRSEIPSRKQRPDSRLNTWESGRVLSPANPHLPVMRIGYARVSTHDQNLDLQTDALRQAGCERIFTDKTSGAKSERPGLNDALSHVRPGDTLVVWRLDRLGRSLRDLIERVEHLRQRDVGFHSLHESIDTTGPVGRFVFHLFSALAEFERELIRERTKAGLAAARARGRVGGRPRAMTAEKLKVAARLMQDPTVSVGEVCRTVGVSRSTLYRYVTSDGQIRRM